MEKVINLISLVVFKIDNALYKTFGIMSSFRRGARARQSRRLQRDLDREHSMRDYLNALNGTSYTTKQALMLQDNNVL